MKIYLLMIFLSLISCRASERYNNVIKPRLNGIDNYYNFEEMDRRDFGIERNINNHGQIESIKYSRKMKVYKNKNDKRLVIFKDFTRHDKSYKVIICDSCWNVILFFSHAGEVY